MQNSNFKIFWIAVARTDSQSGGFIDLLRARFQAFAHHVQGLLRGSSDFADAYRSGLKRFSSCMQDEQMQMLLEPLPHTYSLISRHI